MIRLLVVHKSLHLLDLFLPGSRESHSIVYAYVIPSFLDHISNIFVLSLVFIILVSQDGSLSTGLLVSVSCFKCHYEMSLWFNVLSFQLLYFFNQPIASHSFLIGEVQIGLQKHIIGSLKLILYSILFHSQSHCKILHCVTKTLIMCITFMDIVSLPWQACWWMGEGHPLTTQLV